ncbi:Bug family tripartite tricarboxylate transporter substrate binding protein [Roseicella frigidaeris]|nr:tripartite tricarboxylate transporter substrate-binding protein [Roseicella frigidaeris]
MPRRRALPALVLPALALPALALPALVLPSRARAQEVWPSRPLRVVVAWPPGGSTDTAARLVTAPMQPLLRQPIVIENRGGATGAVGSGVVVQAAPDGYTWLIDASGQAVNQALMTGLGFDYATAFAPVTQLTLLPALLLVRSEAPIRSLEALLAHLKARPGLESYGSSGIGTGSHLASALLLKRAGLAATHVPYRGGAQQIQSVLTGETLFTFSTIPTPAPLIRDGQLRVLGISTARRTPAFPETVPVAEQGFPGFAIADWHGLLAPAGTPGGMIGTMAAAAATALRQEEVRQRLTLLGAEPVGEGPEAFAGFLAAERRRLGAFIREEGIRAE